MRWKSRKPKPEPQVGDTRIVREFLLLPLTIDRETRWLEWARIKQVAYTRHYLSPKTRSELDYIDWMDVEWAEPPGRKAIEPDPRSVDWSKVGHPRKPNIGGVNEKPVGERPEPPPAPPNSPFRYPFRQWTKDNLTAEQPYPWRDYVTILDGRKVVGQLPLKGLAEDGWTLVLQSNP